jgi:endonuclease-3 related protein
MNDHALLLKEFYVRCREHFGYADPWWPGTQAEIVMTSILVQQCDWSAAFRGAQNLTSAGIGDVEELICADASLVQAHIRQVNLAPTKAKRLVALAARMRDVHGCSRFSQFLDSARPASELRRALLDCDGIGPETADSILAFASNHPRFIVDEACRRVFERLNLLPGVEARFWRSPYQRVQQFFDELLAPSLELYDDLSFPETMPRATAIYRDFHAQILELARHHCHKTSPRCRAAGRHGWSDYPICAPHCPPEVCTGCPLVNRCAARRDGQRE